jgi:hypothetical protein
MISTMGPGDLVKFVGPDSRPPWHSGLVVGAMYTIADLKQIEVQPGIAFLVLAGSPGNWHAYHAKHFIKIGDGERRAPPLASARDPERVRELEPA